MGPAGNHGGHEVERAGGFCAASHRGQRTQLRLGRDVGVVEVPREHAHARPCQPRGRHPREQQVERTADRQIRTAVFDAEHCLRRQGLHRHLEAGAPRVIAVRFEGAVLALRAKARRRYAVLGLERARERLQVRIPRVRRHTCQRRVRGGQLARSAVQAQPLDGLRQRLAAHRLVHAVPVVG